MHVLPYDNLTHLAACQEQWDGLSAGIPFRSWAWASTWWRHYGQPQSNRRLCVLAVRDQCGRLAGLAPFCLENRGPMGRVLRLLGSGEVCSDYLGLMCRPGLAEPVSEAIAQWLCRQAGASSADQRWDLLRLEAVDAEDHPTLCLAEALGRAGCWVHRRPGPCCWRVDLPPTWDEYLGSLSKSHRKQVRRADRGLFASGRAVLRTVACRPELGQAMDLLEDLHQRRRGQLGQRGCFASARFGAFHRDVAAALLAQGQLQLHWLELDGRPVAAEYHLSGSGVLYAYQAGVDPEALGHQPGNLITQATLRRAIEQGFRSFDFLRGDEPYKAHWRSRPRPTLEIRAAADRAAARFRQRVWLAGLKVKRFFGGEATPGKPGR